MEILFAIVGFNLASTLFTLFEIIRLESILDEMVRTMTVIGEEGEDGGEGSKPKTFM